MGMWQVLGVGAAVAAPIAVQTGKFAQRYSTLEEYVEWFEAIDKQELFNARPMPAVDEPPPPTLDLVSAGWRHAWWITGLAILIVPPIVGAIIGGVVMSTASGYPAEGLAGGILAGFITLIPAACVAVLVAIILALVRQSMTNSRKVDYDIAQKRHELWEIREAARVMFTHGQLPVAYLEAIGIDPRVLSRA